MRAQIVNAVLFQLAWIAFVGGAGRGNAWLGFAVLVPFAAWQFATSRWPRADALLLGVCGLLGLLIDSSLQAGGLLRYAAPGPWAPLAPPWILGLWMGFGLTMNHSMVFLRGRPLLGFVLGAVAGPLAYAIAARAWAAAELVPPTWRVYAALAVAWGIVTPLLAHAAATLSAHEQRASDPATA